MNLIIIIYEVYLEFYIWFYSREVNWQHLRAKMKQTVTNRNMFYNLVYLNCENTLNNYFSEHMRIVFISIWNTCEVISTATIPRNCKTVPLSM